MHAPAVTTDRARVPERQDIRSKACVNMDVMAIKTHSQSRNPHHMFTLIPVYSIAGAPI